MSGYGLRFVAAACFAGALWGPAGAQVRAGAAAVKITPPPGVPMAGYYAPRLAQGVHDDLWAKAMVLESGGVKAALVSLDLISTTREMVEEARREIGRNTGVPGENVMIGATHSHTGPVLFTGATRDAALGGSTEAAKQYNAALPGRIAEAVKAAESKLAPVAIAAGIGREERLAFNRRFHMKDGSTGWNPGKLNPNILRPAGPIDPDVGVLYLEAENRRPVAAYVNFAMHLDTVGGLQISADYPYTLARLLGEVKGPEMVTLFALGCCGDINHIDVSSPHPQQGHGEAARIGTILAAEALETLKRAKPVSVTGIRVAREMVKLPLREIGSGDVVRAEERISRYGKSDAPSFLEAVEAFRILDVDARKGRPLEVEVQVIALGEEVAFVSLPGEIFVELGLAIKRLSPFRYTFIAELANGSIGYVPHREAYPQGNYEVVSARCAAGSGELLVESAARQLRALYQAAVSTPRAREPGRGAPAPL